MLSVIQTLNVIIITKCSLVSAKIAKSSFETYLLSMLGCLQFTVFEKYHTFAIFNTNKSLKVWGHKWKRFNNKKCAIKCGSHLNLSLGCGIDANNNDAIIFFSTFVTWSC